jgi:hypothetical protein
VVRVASEAPATPDQRASRPLANRFGMIGPPRQRSGAETPIRKPGAASELFF